MFITGLLIVYFYIINYDEESLENSNSSTSIFLQSWRYIALGFSSVFILWQMVAFVRFARTWGKSWYSASQHEEASCKGRGWITLLWLVGIVCLLFSIIAYIGMYYVYSESMSENKNRIENDLNYNYLSKTVCNRNTWFIILSGTLLL